MLAEEDLDAIGGGMQVVSVERRSRRRDINPKRSRKVPNETDYFSDVEQRLST